MNLQEMASQAKEHWKAVNPEVYRQMQQANDLESEAAAVASLTQQEMKALMAVGMSEAEAWQASREIFILTDPANLYDP